MSEDMNPTQQQPDPELKPLEAENSTLEVKVDQAGSITRISTTDETTEQWREWGKQVSEILAELPDYISKFFSDNKRPIITVGLIFTAIITLKLTLALLDAINDIPLLGATCELVGMGYTIWFVYRYLLQASTRQELLEEINSFKGQVMGIGSDSHPS
ncbi:MAG: hypothetical protein NVSMB70_19470 [Chamaesiphon sp.]